MPRPPALFHLIAACTLLLGSSLAHAQYAWIDASGVRHFSDRPPPPSTPPHKILKRPGGTAATDAAPATPATPAKAPSTLAQREEDYRARSKLREEQERKDAMEAGRRRELAAQCRDAREMQAQLASGIRIARFDGGGQRGVMTDEERAQQLARTRNTLAQCRQPAD